MTLVKLDSVSFFNDDYMVSRCEEGGTITVIHQRNHRQIAFCIDDWPQIQDLVNVAMAAFPAAKIFEIQEEDER